MTRPELQAKYILELRTIYENGEAEAITRYVMGAVLDAGESEAIAIDKCLTLLPRLLQHEPVQYVVETAWFCNLRLKVTPDVLIPRPETEELVYHINSLITKKNSRILDIGTGSGCIAFGLKKLLPAATVAGIDISENALTLARENAITLRLAVNFHHLDILQYNNHQDFIHTYEKFDVIVSNPPYILPEEKFGMSANVRDHEPHEALFVPGNDPLLYYSVIGGFAKTFLAKDGTLYFEVHRDRMKEVILLLLNSGFSSVKGSKDMSGNDRFVEAMF